MKKLLPLLILLLLVHGASAKIIVFKKGNCTYVEWSNKTLIYKSNSKYQDIALRKAMDLCSKIHCTIYVLQGNYTIRSAWFYFKSNTSLIGVGNVVFSVIWGGYKGWGFALLTNYNDWKYYKGSEPGRQKTPYDENIKIENIKFYSLYVNWPNWGFGTRFLVFYRVKNLTIEHCLVNDFCGGGGLFVIDSYDVKIDHCKVFHSYYRAKRRVGDAELKVKGENITVDDCYINGAIDTDYGKHFAQLCLNIVGHNITAKDNRILHCGGAIWEETPGTSNVRLIGNVISQSWHCIGISAGDIHKVRGYDYDTKTLVKDNIDFDCVNGVSVLGCSNVTIVYNKFFNDQTGIRLQVATRTRAYMNLVYNTSVGVFIAGQNNTIDGNLIIDSNKAFVFNGRLNYYAERVPNSSDNVVKDNLLLFDNETIVNQTMVGKNYIKDNIDLDKFLEKIGFKFYFKPF